jgi:hypothetical protein
VLAAVRQAQSGFVSRGVKQFVLFWLGFRNGFVRCFHVKGLLGTLDDSRDFAEIVMDLWISGRESGDVEQSFEELANRLLQAKKQHVKVQELDEALFAHDFEV